MTQIDQFESAFRAASRTSFSYERIAINSVLVVTDLGEYESKLFGDRMRSFLRVIDPDSTKWRDTTGDECRSVGDLLDLVEQARPDLICTYRNLQSGGWRWPYSLGEHLDVLTQVTTTPVLVVPRPDDQQHFEAATQDTNSVMAITDHLTGDQRLVNFAVRMCERQGRLLLTHIEDAATFERYIDAIGKITSIDTDDAREAIMRRLLKDPADYIEGCREALDEHNLGIDIEPIVTMGHKLADYQRLIEEHRVDVLVLNTKDADQLAMHGLAYPLAIELRHHALLML